MTTFTNACVFDGTAMLPGTRTVTLDGNRIAAISDKPGDASAIDLGGMTLMPGMITSHFHPDFYKFKIGEGVGLGKELPPGVLMAIGVRNCGVLLESGFTGYVGAACGHDIDASLKIAIAEGIIPGPRIRACSLHIGTTGDVNDSDKWWRQMVSTGTDIFVDGPEDMRKATREMIRRGAETIKIFTSTGHGIPGPSRNMDRDEIAAVVGAAHMRGAKVRAHCATRDMIAECVELGVDIIDHGDEVDEALIDRMAKAGTFWVPSLVYTQSLMQLGWGDAVLQGHIDHVRRMLPIAHKAGVKVLVGDDYSGVFRDMIDDDPLDHKVGNYAREFAMYGALDGLSPADVLSWGTKNAGEALVGAPGQLGVIAPGALADLIVVDGDPLADLSLLARPGQALKAVIRDGVMIIDRLSSQQSRKAA
jgi:imidazolonepropionase-like amidohydrolase